MQAPINGPNRPNNIGTTTDAFIVSHYPLLDFQSVTGYSLVLRRATDRLNYSVFMADILDSNLLNR